LYNGSRFLLFGSQDITDDNTTSITNLHGAIANQYRTRAATSGWAPGNEIRYALIGVTDNGTVDKITATSSGSAAGVRQFTPNRISLFDNIFVNTSTTTAWPIDGLLSQALFSRTAITIANWRFAVGQYYNKSGVLTGNNVITDLNQVPFYVGGTKDGNYFVPKEFSVSLPTMPRAGIDVYKLIGYFNSATNMYLTDYQTVYQFRNGQWVTLEALADGAVQIENLIPKESDLNTWKYMGKEVEPGKYLYCCRVSVPSGPWANTNNTPTQLQIRITPPVLGEITLPDGNPITTFREYQKNIVHRHATYIGAGAVQCREFPITANLHIGTGPQGAQQFISSGYIHCQAMNHNPDFPEQNSFMAVLTYQSSMNGIANHIIEGFIYIIAE